MNVRVVLVLSLLASACRPDCFRCGYATRDHTPGVVRRCDAVDRSDAEAKVLADRDLGAVEAACVEE
jgi:hypothetical protein